MEQQIIQQDPEGQMTKADLYRAAKSAMKLFDMISDNQDLEGWVQSKITTASVYLDDVYHHLEYQSKFGHQGGPQGLNTLDDIKGEPELHDDKADIDLDGIEESISYEQQLEHLLESAKKKETHISELSNKTLASYAKKATDDAIYNTGVAQRIAGSTKSSQQSRDTMKKHNDQTLKRQRGVNQALDKMAKESVEEAKKPSTGLTKKEKSAVVKKAKAGKDIGGKGKGFEKVAKKAAKEYGSKEKGEKVAAAAMWKNIPREESVEDVSENVELDELSTDTYKNAAKALKTKANSTTIKAIQAGRKNKGDVETTLNKKADKQYKSAAIADKKAVAKKVTVKESAESSKDVLTESTELTRIKKLSGL